MSMNAFYNAVVANYWTPDRVNIYFMGQVEAAGNTSWNVDPEEAEDGPPLPRSITIINDGFDSQRSPELLMAGNALEHEIAHFFGRWLGDTFLVPGPPRTYNDGGTEHVPDGSYNLLERFFPYNYLVIPGRSNQEGSEKNEIWKRVDEDRVFEP